MKKTFYIESIRYFKDPECPSHMQYCPVPQNAQWLYNMWKKHSLQCVGIKQWNDEQWKVRLKGKRNDIQEFVCDFSIQAQGLYNLRETCW